MEPNHKNTISIREVENNQTINSESLGFIKNMKGYLKEYANEPYILAYQKQDFKNEYLQSLQIIDNIEGKIYVLLFDKYNEHYRLAVLNIQLVPIKTLSGKTQTEIIFDPRRHYGGITEKDQFNLLTDGVEYGNIWYRLNYYINFVKIVKLDYFNNIFNNIKNNYTNCSQPSLNSNAERAGKTNEEFMLIFSSILEKINLNKNIKPVNVTAQKYQVNKL